jgi:hypothetical protein
MKNARVKRVPRSQRIRPTGVVNRALGDDGRRNDRTNERRADDRVDAVKALAASCRSKNAKTWGYSAEGRVQAGDVIVTIEAYSARDCVVRAMRTPVGGNHATQSSSRTRC